MLNDLLLLSGNDIPFEKAKLIIHQPTIKEIAYIGEESFYTGCEFLRFSKDNLNEEDRINLENLSNFEIIMSIIKEQNAIVQKNKVCVFMVLTMLFPKYKIDFKINNISLTDIETNEIFIIDKNNYDEFLQILNSMFCLSEGSNLDYNPKGDLAKRIADKLKKRHQKLAEDKPAEYNQKVDILSRYVSILAVGEHKDINTLLQYTVYQLFDEFKRYELKMNYDIYLQAKLAGAKDLKEVDD
ncbi:MAG: hypothetical protein ACI4PE_03185 [Bacilli bacterium]